MKHSKILSTVVVLSLFLSILTPISSTPAQTKSRPRITAEALRVVAEPRVSEVPEDVLDPMHFASDVYGIIRPYTNDDTSTFTWTSITADDPWVLVSPSSMSIPPGESRDLTVYVDRYEKSVGTYGSTVRLVREGGVVEDQLAVTMDVASQYIGSVDLGYLTEPIVTTVILQLPRLAFESSWQITSWPEWTSDYTPSSGVVAPGSGTVDIPIQLTLDPTGLPAGSYLGELWFTTSMGPRGSTLGFTYSGDADLKDFNIGVWAKGDSEASALVSAWQYDATGAGLAGSSTWATYTDADWTYSERAASFEPDARWVILGVTAEHAGSSSGSVCFDDIVFQEIRDGTPSSNLALNASFEEGSSWPEGWGWLTGSATFIWSYEAHTGSRSICISDIPEVGSILWRASYAIPVDVDLEYISGRVYDMYGWPIEGVTVYDDAGHSTTTNSRGDYVLSGLAPGTYAVVPMKSGMVFDPPSHTVTVPASAIAIDFHGDSVPTNPSISRIEVNQATQDITGTIPLVANKNTAVRVHLDTQTEVKDVTGELTISRAGVPIPGSPYHPVNNVSGTITAKVDPDPTSNTDDSLNFAIPGSVLDPGSYTFGVTLFRDGHVIDFQEQDFEFAERRGIRLLYYLVEVGGELPNPARAASAYLFLRRTYPVARDGVEFINGGSVISSLLPIGCELRDVPGDVGLQATLSRLRDEYNAEHPGSEADFVVGIVPEDGLEGCAGFANPCYSYTAVVEDHPQVFQDGTTPLHSTLAHELGHVIAELGDEYQGGKFACEINPPAPHVEDWAGNTCPPTSYEEETIAGNCEGTYTDPMAFDVDLGTTLDGPNYVTRCDELGDERVNLMGAVASSLFEPDVNMGWVSDATYRYLYNHAFDPLLFRIAGIDSTVADEYLIVSARIYQDDDVELDAWNRVDGSMIPTVFEGGDYSLVIRDDSDVVLASHAFQVDFELLTNPPMIVEAAPVSFVVPYPSTASTFVLKHGDTILASVSVSEHSPEVTLVAPNGGENWDGIQTVSWSADDLDGDDLVYFIDYTPDGVDWFPIGINITTTTFLWDTGYSPGGDGARIRVTASDGVNTGQDTSDGAFTVTGKAPLAKIVSPIDGSLIRAGEPIWLTGIGSDLEDGMLGDSYLSWESDVDGHLGIGETNLIFLSPGYHSITLTVSDSEGNPSSDSVGVFVGSKVYLPLVLRNYTAGSGPINNPPNVPYNPSPSKGATNQSVNVNLSWSGGDLDGDIVTYDVYFQANDSTPGVVVCNDVTIAFCDLATLDYDTHYYWRVVARDEHGATTIGPVWDFTTASGSSGGDVWYVDKDATGNETGSNWIDAFNDLQDALASAQAGDEVWVAEGIYVPTYRTDPGDARTATFQLASSVSLYGGFGGYEASRDERDWTTHGTVLSGDIGTEGEDSDNSYHVVTSLSSVDAVLDGFTITAGRTNWGGSCPDACGGGLYNDHSNLLLANITFSSNTAQFGGAMYNLYASPTLKRVAFSDNYSDSGGGIYSYYGSLEMLDSILSENQAEDGGGMVSMGTTPINLVNVVLSRNIAAGNAGGMSNWQSSPDLINVTFSSNVAGASGGGMYNRDSEPRVTNCILWGNSAASGDQIYNESSTPQISYSDVEGFWPGVGNIDANPEFIDADNGNLHLQVGSPAINAGNSAVMQYTTDLDGMPRIVCGVIDMGPYEFQACP